MTTDDDDLRLDARLRAAGERWRAATDIASTDSTAASAVAAATAAGDEELLDVGRVHDLATPRGRRRATWLLSAAAVAAAAVGIGFAVSGPGGGGHGRPVATSEAGSSGLDGTSWRLSTLTVDGRRATIAGSPTLAFDGGKISGSNGCNFFGGTVSVDGDTMTIGDLAETANGCLPAPGATGPDSITTINEILQGSVHWSIDAGRLTITSDHGTLVYVAVATPASNGLTDVDWTLRSAGDPKGTTVAAPPGVTLHIDSKGAFVAGDGCAGLSGTATIDRDTATVRLNPTPAIGCLDKGFSGGTTLVDQILGAQWKWVREGDTLTVANDHGTLIYTTAPDATTSSGPTGAGSGPADLPGTWVMNGYEHEDATSGTGSGVAAGSAGGTAPDNGLGTTITITDGTITIKHACYSDRGDLAVTARTLVISHVTLKDAVPCASNAGSEYDVKADDVLTGTSTWSLESGRLSISKGGDTLQFDRVATASGSGGVGTASDLPASASVPPPSSNPAGPAAGSPASAGGGSSLSHTYVPPPPPPDSSAAAR
ncbi:MAG: META domain-containing protein [Jatrophihabitans sp.]|uniref:META domain-containing protein n=1 Tax=Jatrophihabitans sp. TaxID=1932789 RepID=UPI003F7E79B2